MIDCQSIGELVITLKTHSPGGRDQPLRSRQWPRSSFPPSPPTVALLQPSVTAGVNASICASVCHPDTQACANASRNCGCLCRKGGGILMHM